MLRGKKIGFKIISGAIVVLLGGNLFFQNYLDVKAESIGRWMTGEYHVHTVQSNDVSEKEVNTENILETGFNKYNYDWIFFADHLRMSPREINGEPIINENGEEVKEARYKAIEKQLQEIDRLVSEGKYDNKIIYTGFEWDMLGYDHASVGIIDESNEVPLEGIKAFEYLFSKDTKETEFEDEYKNLLGNRLNENNKENTFKAIEWLKENYPESYVLINHPSRKNGDKAQMNIEDIRAMNDLAPNIVFGFEGMPGNQMAASGNRGELVDIYGGTDVMVAEVGGIWDALLGEGRHFYNFTNSDFHFKISTNRLYSSGYWPGEYAKNYTWVEGNNIQSIVDGLRSGKSFSVYGDLINELDFNITNRGDKAEMGSDLEITEGDNYTITIRFKSPKTNNYEQITEHETDVTNEVYLDHIDLIAGDITGKISPDSQEYSNPINESTKVIARFTKDDWTVDSEGYNVIKYEVKDADKSTYYRLRGTNLGTDVEGETINGEPVIDESFDYEGPATEQDNELRFNNLNDRNYSDMWFYSNPIFVNVSEVNHDLIIEEELKNIDKKIEELDLSGVINDFSLPLSDKEDVNIEWNSNNKAIELEDKGDYILAHVNRPSIGEKDELVKLNVTIMSGEVKVNKEYEFIVKALEEEIIQKPNDEEFINDNEIKDDQLLEDKEEVEEDAIENEIYTNNETEEYNKLPETGGINTNIFLSLSIVLVVMGCLILKSKFREN